MPEGKIYHCLNNGCIGTFKHWMQRSRHLEKGCKGTPKEKPVETVVKSGTGYVCKICSTALSSIKIMFKGIKRHAKVLIKKEIEYPCSFCDRIFV